MKTNTQSSARIVFSDGQVSAFQDQKLAYLVWLSLPTNTRAAFRGQGDQRKVYAWDYADKPMPI